MQHTLHFSSYYEPYFWTIYEAICNCILWRIFIYNPTLYDHLLHVEATFKCLVDHDFFLKQSKCSFAQNSIEYLCHIVSIEGFGLDHAKNSHMTNWTPMNNVKKLRGFLVLAKFYRKFVQNYASKVIPVIMLLKRNHLNGRKKLYSLSSLWRKLFLK